MTTTETRTLGADVLRSGGTGDLTDKKVWEPGDVVDGIYLVGRELGRGGMGLVQLVRHLGWDLEMAVKMPLGGRGTPADGVLRERFAHEARLWVELGLHPNIVQCWFVRELGGSPRAFIEYMPGGSVADALRNGRLFASDLQSVLDLGIQACDGLAHAHARGVIHRDVKPSNLMLSGARLALTDLGIAAAGALADGPPGGGTPGYSPPERFAREIPEPRGDIYSLGCTLFEILCGHRPFEGAGETVPPAQLAARHLSWEAPEPRASNPALPPALSLLLRRCLAKVPAERPGTSEVRAELAAVFNAVTGTPYPRALPSAATLRADSLNNRAASFFDLGQTDQARRALAEALREDPQHPQATYNLALARWHAGEQTDTDTVDDLSRLRVSGDKQATLDELRGAIEHERGQGLTAIDVGATTIASGRVLAFDHRNQRVAVSEDGWVEIRALSPHSTEDSTISRFRPDGSFGIRWSGCFSPDGALFLLVSMDAEGRRWQLSIWETARGSRRRVEELPKGESDPLLLPRRILLRNDGAIVRVERSDETMRHALVFLPASRSSWLPLAASDGGEPVAIDVATEGSMVVANGDGLIRTHAANGIARDALARDRQAVRSACFSPHDTRVVACCAKGTVRWWDIEAGRGTEAGAVHSVPDRVQLARVDASGHWLAAWSRIPRAGAPDEGTIRLWHLASQRCVSSVRTPEPGPRADLTFDAGGTLFAATGDWRQAWALPGAVVPAPTAICRPRGSHELGEVAAALERDKAELAQLLSAGRHPEAYRLARRAQARPEHRFDPDLLRAVRELTNRGGRLGLAEHWLHLQHALAGGANGTALGFVDRGRLVSGSASGDVQVWDLAERRCLIELGHHGGAIRVIAPAGPDRIATADESGETRVFDLGRGVCVACLRPGRPVKALAVSPDGQMARLVHDGGVSDWSVPIEEEVGMEEGSAWLPPEAKAPPRLALRPEKDRVYIVDGTGRRLATIGGHVPDIGAVALSPDERFVASADASGLLRVWEFDWELDLAGAATS